VTLALRFLARLPNWLSWRVSGGLAWVWWWVVPVRKKLAVRNFSAAFPGEKPGPALRQSVRSMIEGYVEFVRENRTPSLKYRFSNFEMLCARAKDGKGALVLTGHGGAWELLGRACAKELNLPITLIVRRPASARTRDWVERLRESSGMQLLPPEGSFFDACQAVREGRVVVCLLDQRHNGGLKVPFFDRPAKTSKGLALMAYRTGVPVFGAWAFREGLGHHHFVLYSAFDMSGDVGEDTASFAAFTEARIRECPAHWLWLHARWRDGGEV